MRSYRNIQHAKASGISSAVQQLTAVIRDVGKNCLVGFTNPQPREKMMYHCFKLSSFGVYSIELEHILVPESNPEVRQDIPDLLYPLTNGEGATKHLLVW